MTETFAPDHLATLLKLKGGRLPFFAASYPETQIHRQLVMAGFASCRVELSGEYIMLTPKGKQAIGVRA